MNNDVFIIGEGFYLAFFFSSFNFTPFFIVIEMVDCFFHYIISYSFLRCLSEDNWDAAKPPKKIGQERITITKRKRKKKKKERVTEGITKFWSSPNVRQFPALPQTSLLTSVKSHSPIHFFVPWLLSIPFHHTISFPTVHPKQPPLFLTNRLPNAVMPSSQMSQKSVRR